MSPKNRGLKADWKGKTRFRKVLWDDGGQGRS